MHTRHISRHHGVGGWRGWAFVDVVNSVLFRPIFVAQSRRLRGAATRIKLYDARYPVRRTVRPNSSPSSRLLRDLNVPV